VREDTELLKGAIDVHLHAGPSVFPRLMDAVEAAEAARAAGMRGIVIKHHHTPTVDRAYLVHRAVPEVEAASTPSPWTPRLGWGPRSSGCHRSTPSTT
jgi:hypothetical protein